jgi:cell division protein ZapE
MSETTSDRYQALVASAEITSDAGQRAAARALDRLAVELDAARSAGRPRLMRRLGFSAPPPAPKGVYLWGGVGRGKSMMMDLFFEGRPQGAGRRVHFHAFMLDVHARLHAARTAAPDAVSADPLPGIARSLIGDARVLCFDELHVTDIADAMILGRLFKALLGSGVAIVATSNRPPRDLYKYGLQRELFVPFIDLIEASLEIVHLDSGIDYRFERMKGLDVYLVPGGPDAHRRLSDAFRVLTVGARPKPATLNVLGRTLTLAAAAEGCARASFADLCGQPLGPADYLAIAERFHTLILDDIPRLSAERRNEAKRFSTLIDALYEHRCNLICSAAAEPFELYPAGEQAFEFQRTASRLVEMRTEGYWAEPHRGA